MQCLIPKVHGLLNSALNYELVYKTCRLSCWKSDEGLRFSENKFAIVEHKVNCISMVIYCCLRT